MHTYHIYIYMHTFNHLADAFIQSNLQMIYMQKPLKVILVKNEITILSECSPHILFIKYFHFKCAKSQPQPIQKYQHLHRNIVAERNAHFKEKRQTYLGAFASELFIYTHCIYLYKDDMVLLQSSGV